MSVSARVLKSSGFLLGIQFFQRFLGVISTLILARLLAPEHFGVVALVTIALQFFELLVETGNQQYIVQKDQVSDDDLNTAWTMDILIKSGIAVVIVLSSPALATYFETPALALALSVASLALPIRALRTPGLMLLAKHLDYRPVFYLNLWQKSASFLCVIAIAWIHPSYWAIIIGNLVSATILAAGSYRVNRYRPRPSLINLGHQWRFSKWLLLRGMVGFTRSQIDNLIVSKLFGTTRLGGYNLIREVSILPAVSVIIPMSEPLLAAIAKGRNNPTTLAYRVRFSLAMMTTVLTPITGFMLLYPELIVIVLLGNDWQEYAPLLQAFALFFFTFCLFALVSDAVIALGRVQALFWFDVVSTSAIIVLLLTLGTESLAAMAWVRGWLAVLTTAALLYILERWTAFGLFRLARLCLPAVAGSLVAGVLVRWLNVSDSTPLLQLLVYGSLYVAICGAVMVSMAWLFYRNSAEFRQTAELMAGLVTRLVKRRSKALE